MVQTYVVPPSNGMSGARDVGSYGWDSLSLSRRILMSRVNLITPDELDIFTKELSDTLTSLDLELEAIRGSFITGSQEEVDASPLKKALAKRKFAKLFLTKCYRVFKDRKKLQWQEEKEKRKQEKLEQKANRVQNQERAHQINLENKAAKRLENERLLVLANERRDAYRVAHELDWYDLKEAVNRSISFGFSKLVREEIGVDRYTELKTKAIQAARDELLASIRDRLPTNAESTMLSNLANASTCPDEINVNNRKI